MIDITRIIDVKIHLEKLQFLTQKNEWWENYLKNIETFERI